MSDQDVFRSYTDNRYRPLEEELLFRPLSRPIARALARTPVTPTMVNFAGCAAAIGAGWLLASGAAGLLPALAVYAAFLVDKVDGDLARAQGVAGGRGQYTDGFLDLVGEAALTIGAAIALGDVPPLLLGASVAAPLLFYYHGVAVPFYLQRVSPVHRAPEGARGWRTLFRYGRAKHFLLVAVLALIGRLDLLFVVLPLLALYTFALFMRNVLRRA